MTKSGKSRGLRTFPTPAKEGVAKSKKALNHKDTKAQRKPFLSPGRSLSWPGKNFVSPCLCGSLLFRAFCDALEGGCRKKHKSLEPQRPQRKRKALLCALCGSFFSGPFATTSFAEGRNGNQSTQPATQCALDIPGSGSGLSSVSSVWRQYSRVPSSGSLFSVS